MLVRVGIVPGYGNQHLHIFRASKQKGVAEANGKDFHCRSDMQASSSDLHAQGQDRLSSGVVDKIEDEVD